MTIIEPITSATIQQPIIALDADGVLLNYNHTYGKIWRQCFGKELSVKEPLAYHATTYYGVTNPPKDGKFWQMFDQEGWSDMEPLPGAVEACQRLRAAGYHLVCVTSMPEHRGEHRLANLKKKGFPIERVLATGGVPDKTANPKQAIIEQLMPAYFVDDELRKLTGLPATVKCVLVDPGYSDGTNTGKDTSYLHWQVKNLAEFAERLVMPKPQRAGSPVAGK